MPSDLIQSLKMGGSERICASPTTQRANWSNAQTKILDILFIFQMSSQQRYTIDKDGCCLIGVIHKDETQNYRTEWQQGVSTGYQLAFPILHNCLGIKADGCAQWLILFLLALTAQLLLGGLILGQRYRSEHLLTRQELAYCKLPTKRVAVYEIAVGRYFPKKNIRITATIKYQVVAQRPQIDGISCHTANEITRLSNLQAPHFMLLFKSLIDVSIDTGQQLQMLGIPHQ